MRTWFSALALMLAVTCARADGMLQLGNDPWPPFIVPGVEAGTAERLVCEALQRAGWACEIETGDWSATLEAARAGTLDGIAALWKTPEREAFLHYSDPYLTNRIVGVTREDAGWVIESLSELTGRRVALERDVAYGDEISLARSGFRVIEVASVEDALRAVDNGEAEAALVDELIAREFMNSEEGSSLKKGSAALAFRELHFGMSRQHPRAEEVIEAFNRSFQVMLEDGTVNEILEVDWLVTDVGRDGDLDFVLRHSVSPADLADPVSGETAYALRQAEYLEMAHPGWQQSRAAYHVKGQEHDSLASALDAAYGRKTACGYDRWSAHVVCTESKVK